MATPPGRPVGRPAKTSARGRDGKIVSHSAARAEKRRRAIRAELCRLLELPAEFESPAIRAAAQFPLFAPRPYLDQIEPGNPHDPLLRQILPLDDELSSPPGFSRSIRSAILLPAVLRAYCRNTKAGRL